MRLKWRSVSPTFQMLGGPKPTEGEFGRKHQIPSKLFRVSGVLPFRMNAFRCLLIPFGATLLVAEAKPLPQEEVERVATQIDQALIADLQKSRRVPESLVNDATFVRRAYLGIIGRIPSAANFVGKY